MTNFLLDILSFGAILSGILVITSKNPVISVLFLISVFVNVAGYLVLLGVGFIGISYLIVYVGAIAVLFLFVIMILNLQLAELTTHSKEYTQNLPLGAIVGSLFSLVIISIIKEININAPFNFSELYLGSINSINTIILGMSPLDSKGGQDIYQTFNTLTHSDQNITNFIQIQSIGQVLYTNCSIWLILCSFILLLGLVGPISLSINRNKESNNSPSSRYSKVNNNRTFYHSRQYSTSIKDIIKKKTTNRLLSKTQYSKKK